MHRYLMLLYLILAALPAVAEGPRTADEPPSTPSWIWKNATPGENERVFFRREFQLPPDVASASVIVVCDDWYQLFINGHDMGMGSGWRSPRSYDVLAWIKPGSRNVIAVEARNEKGPAGLALQFHLTLKDGRKLQVVSDANWLCSNEAPEAWQTLDFPTPSWPKATVIAKMGEPPWCGVMKPEPVDPASSVDKTPTDHRDP
ncbi:MAG: hypothetical protein ABI600_20520 [Luteolibacter sp.]